jgi:Flp pilus assembly protein TadD
VSSNRSRAARRLALAWLVLAPATCAQPSGLREARSALRTNDLPTARRLLEADRERSPRDVEVLLTLGQVYYRSARDALDWDGDEGRYLYYFERAMDALVSAAQLAPEDPDPHLYLATIDLYRGDLESCQRGLRNVRRLAPGPIADTNIAEGYIYAGDLAEASRWNQAGRLAGSRPGPVTFNEMLAHWSAGDVAAARHAFEILRVQSPDSLRTINMAPLPTMPRSFEEFAGYCCASPGCGPYLEHACAALSLPVKYREVSNETLLEELRVEMESRRRLREVYRQRKELELGAEGDTPDGP